MSASSRRSGLGLSRLSPSSGILESPPSRQYPLLAHLSEGMTMITRSELLDVVYRFYPRGVLPYARIHVPPGEPLLPVARISALLTGAFPRPWDCRVSSADCRSGTTIGDCAQRRPGRAELRAVAYHLECHYAAMTSNDNRAIGLPRGGASPIPNRATQSGRPRNVFTGARSARTLRAARDRAKGTGARRER